ncbi:unnamed protein product [Linum tenue]|uniref:C2H2-type domain-containing protein n=1 Tax=Linum tenue TaxID=586396 RepID=A0AAV0Q4E3_9ROSI|nr:unnamed protein product [Linum tenue]
MKSHLPKFPIPPPKSSSPTTRRRRLDCDPATESSSSISYTEEEEEEDEELEVEQQFVKSGAAGWFVGGCDAVVYGLRDNPTKSFRVADPEFSDRESETESRNPTRRRSKRTRNSGGDEKKESPPEAAEEEPMSSVSDTSPEEDVAMCLVMLSRDVNWKRRFSYNRGEIEEEEEDETENGGEIKKWAKIEEEDQRIMERSSRIQGKKLKCEKCMKQFRSSQALGSHRRICFLQLGGGRGMGNVVAGRIFRCPYCYKVFGSGQALGGHKRSHLTGGGFYPPPAAIAPPPPSAAKIDKNYSYPDLNLPAPVEEDEFSASVVSDA